MRNIYASILVIAQLFFFVGVTISQSSNKNGLLSGKVSDEKGASLPGASIFIHDVKAGAIADTGGNYTTSRVTDGRYLVEVTHQGYASAIASITIAGNTHKDFTLSITAVEQEAVTVTGVSSATRLRNSPQPVSLVKKNDLLQNAAPNLLSALARKGGVSVISTGPAISKPVIRGLSYNRVVTVNDGIRQEGQQWGDEHGIEIDEYSVQKAEILKGPASLMYGSDAIAGVINFITNQPVSEGSIKGNILTSYTGNNKSYGSYANLAGNLRNGFNWNAYGSFKSAGDYKNKYDGRVFNSRFDEKNWGGYFGLNKSWGFTHFILSSYDQNLGITEGVRDSATGKFLIFTETPIERIATNKELDNRRLYTPYQHVRHFKAALDNSISVGKNRIAATLALQRNQRQEFGDPFATSTPDLFFDLHTVNYSLHYQISGQNGWKTTVGTNGMYQQNGNKAEEKLIPEYDLFDAGVFLLSSKNVKDVTVSGGLRWDTRNMHLKGLNEGGFEKFADLSKSYGNVSGSIGIAYEASDIVTLKVNAARGYRSPNAAELGSNGAHEGTYRYEYGDNNLKTEKSLQFDAGLVVASRHISFGVSAFYNHVSDYIYYRRLTAKTGGDSIIYDNGVRLEAFKFSQSGASLAGFEANFDIHPHPLDWLHFENTFSFVAGHFDQSLDNSRSLPMMPPAHLLSELRGNFAKAGRTLRNLYFKVEMDATAQQRRVFTAYNTETPTKGYALFDVGGGTELYAKQSKVVSIYVSVNNITDVAYQSHLSRLKYTDTNNVTGRPGIFNMGRNVNVKLNFPLNLK